MFFIALFLGSFAWAASVPQIINFQGRLTDNFNNPETTTVNFTFKFFDSLAGGNQLPVGSPWSETQSISVTNGVFNALIGSQTSIPYTVFQTTSVYMEITVAGQTLSPRETLVTSPFAFNAQTLTGLTYDTFVDTYTNQTVNGLKTFSTFPQMSGAGAQLLPSQAAQLATKAYVDSVGGSSALLASTNVWTAAQTFTSSVTVSTNFFVTGGNVGIGTMTPGALLDITGDGSTVLVPRKSTAGDPLTGANGMIYYNANSGQIPRLSGWCLERYGYQCGHGHYSKPGYPAGRGHLLCLKRERAEQFLCVRND